MYTYVDVPVEISMYVYIYVYIYTHTNTSSLISEAIKTARNSRLHGIPDCMCVYIICKYGHVYIHIYAYKHIFSYFRGYQVCGKFPTVLCMYVYMHDMCICACEHLCVYLHVYMRANTCLHTYSTISSYTYKHTRMFCTYISRHTSMLSTCLQFFK